MKRAHKLLVLVALVLALATTLPAALAYFTTNAAAGGTRTVNLGSTIIPDEEIDKGGKTLIITNDANSAQAVFVRAQAFAAAPIELSFGDNTGWTGSTDGWYYLAAPLDPGEKAEFRVNITNPMPGTVKEDEFEVTVVYETIPAQYGSDGKASDPTKVDWSKPLVSGTAPSGN